MFTPERLTSYFLRLEVLLGLLLPPHHTSSSSSTGAAAATGTHVFAEGAYDMVMETVLGDSSRTEVPMSSSSDHSSSSLSWASNGSVQLLHLAAMWHAIMRARARKYDSYGDR
jgi:hypothetical protein